MNAKESPSASTSFNVPSLVFQWLFYFSPLFCFSASFSFQFRRFSFCFSIPFLFSSASPFLFFNVLPFFQPKILFQPKTFFSPRYFFSPKISPCLWFSASFLSFNVLPFSPSLVQPSIFKAIKNSSFGSVYPRPNILSSCFTFLLFE